MKFFRWEPEAVACARGNIRKGITFDAEVAFGEIHRVVGKNFSSREEAKSAAQAYVNQIKSGIQAVVDKEIGGFPVAQE